MKEPQADSLPLCHLTGPVLATRTDVWAYFIVKPVGWAFLSDNQNEQYIMDTASTYARLRQPHVKQPRLTALWEMLKSSRLPDMAEIHVRTACKQHSPEAWETQFRARVPHHPGLDQHVNRVREVVTGSGYWEKITYLGVRLGSRPKPAKKLTPLTETELTAWVDAAHRVGVTLTGSALAATPATTKDMVWLLRHITHGPTRDLEPVPDRDVYKPVDLFGLTAAEIHQGPGTTHNGAGEHTTVLSFAKFPRTMRYPHDGPPWACAADWAFSTAIPTEYSMRARLISPQQVDADIRRKLAAVDEERELITGAGQRVPLALAEQAEEGQLLQHAVTRQGDPLAYVTHRLIFTAPGSVTANDWASQIASHYKAEQITVTQPLWRQVPLRFETIPGGAPRVKVGLQQQPMTTIAGGIPQAAEALGDGIGPYVGTASTQTRAAAVHWSPSTAANRNRPTLFAIIGLPGGGKSWTAARIALDAAVAESQTVVVLDPVKNELLPLEHLIRAGGKPVSTVRIDESHTGMLDPFRIGGSTSEKIQRVVEVVLMLLGDATGAVHKDSRNAAIHEAVDKVAEGPDPSLRKVVDHLWAAHDAAKADGDRNRIERNLAVSLGAIAKMPLGSLIFGEPTQEPLNITGRTTLISFAGLTLPETRTASNIPEREVERLSVTLFYLTTEYIQGLFNAARSEKKLLIIDEAWALTRTRQGAALIERMARTGRSYNISVGIASHNVADLLDERVRGCVSTVFATRSDDPTEAAAVLQILNIENDERNRRWLRDLKTGEAIMRDLDGRVGVIRVDNGGPLFMATMDTNPDRIQSPTVSPALSPSLERLVAQ